MAVRESFSSSSYSNHYLLYFTGAVFGAMRLKTKHRKLYRQYYLPWAIKNGSIAKPLMNVYWEKRWDQDMDELRKELNVELLTIPK